MQTAIQTERPTDRQAGRETDKQTERQIDKASDPSATISRYTDKTERVTDRHSAVDVGIAGRQLYQSCAVQHAHTQLSYIQSLTRHSNVPRHCAGQTVGRRWHREERLITQFICRQSVLLTYRLADLQQQHTCYRSYCFSVNTTVLMNFICHLSRLTVCPTKVSKQNLYCTEDRASWHQHRQTVKMLQAPCNVTTAIVLYH